MSVTVRTILLSGLLAALITPGALAADPVPNPTAGASVQPLPTPWSWDAETLELLATQPVQEGGRVKPLDTHVSYLLLRMAGRRAVYVQEVQTDSTVKKHKIGPVAWLLECLLYPQRAATHEIFLVNTDEVIDGLDLTVEDKKKRDRYTYEELRPARGRLFQLASQYHQLDPRRRSTVQEQTINLATNVRDFELLQHQLDWARQIFQVPENQHLTALGSRKPQTFSQVLATASELRTVYHGLEGAEDMNPEGGTVAEARQALDTMMAQLSTAVAQGGSLRLFPPVDPATETWATASDLAAKAFAGELVDGELAYLASVEAMVQARTRPEKVKQALEQLHQQVTDAARARGEFDTVPMEVSFYRADLFYRSLLVYLVGFLLVAISWMRPGGRILAWLIPTCLTLATLLLVVGISWRCVIRGRPPVTTLYETVLFITATAVVVALVIELFNRQKIAMTLAAVIGSGGLFLAHKYELKEGTDTMPAMQAVLDTNFWLATHVTTITMGYAAGFLASALAHVYLLGRLVGWRQKQPAFYQNLATMVYGVTGFGLLFSVVGTILGGIWANESWGRFWGWDPKENGALLIVLSQLILMHAWKGKYIRDHGICILAVLVGMVVAFSWWGVNLLGQGLHSYGFTSGIAQVLNTFYLVELVVVVLGGVAWVRIRARDLTPSA